MAILQFRCHVEFPEYPESDLNVTLLRFSSGVIGKVVTSFGSGRPQDHSVRIYGSQKCIENNLLFDRDGSCTIFEKPSLPRATGDDGKFGGRKNRAYGIIFDFLFEKLVNWYAPRQHADYAFSSYPLRLYEHSFAVRASILSFVTAIRHGTRPECDVVDAAKTVATCLAGVEACRTGKKIFLRELAAAIPRFS